MRLRGAGGGGGGAWQWGPGSHEAGAQAARPATELAHGGSRDPGGRSRRPSVSAHGLCVSSRVPSTSQPPGPAPPATHGEVGVWGEGLCRGQRLIGGSTHQEHLGLAVSGAVLFPPTTRRARTRLSSLVSSLSGYRPRFPYFLCLSVCSSLPRIPSAVSYAKGALSMCFCFI